MSVTAELSIPPLKNGNPPSGGTETFDLSFRDRILKAVGWSMAAYVSGYVLRLVASLAMTRLLVPEMFGIMAVATIVQVVTSMLCDVGLRQAIIQSERGDQQAFLDTAWTMQIIRGGIIWVVCCLCALGIARCAGEGFFLPGSVYADQVLPWIIVTMSFSAVILGFQSTKAMTSDRHLNQRQLATIELVSQAAGLIVAFGIGYLTRSIWSFVVSALAAAIINVAMTHLYLTGTRNRLRMDRACFNELMGFGRWMFISSLFTVLAANGDRIMLAGWTDPAVLGLYVLAFNLVAMIDGAGGRLFWSVATAAFSKIANERPETIRSSYYRSRLPFDLIYVGSAGLFYSGGEAVVQILYDARYAQAGYILQILSFGLLLSRFGLTSALFLAIGRPQYLGLISGIRTLSLFVAVPVGHYLAGFEGALWAIALHGIATVPVIVALKWREGLNRFGFEIAVLLFWPVGYVVGRLASHALSWLPSVF
ncbi:oligosaccharide flippase family protein [Corticibacterium sp. UT-5YL-CI-8]|nr:oligosaccharide flippase family protein [Tianweitania sp. UT-5YL-CI-8]